MSFEQLGSVPARDLWDEVGGCKSPWAYLDNFCPLVLNVWYAHGLSQSDLVHKAHYIYSQNAGQIGPGMIGRAQSVNPSRSGPRYEKQFGVALKLTAN